MENCFFCGKPKLNFNIEHFFPETIGGKFSNRICNDCNTKLNESIDRPFLLNPYIGYNRKIHKLVKQSNRNIPNPFKGKLRNGDDCYTLSLNSNGTIETRLIPKIIFPKSGNLAEGIKITIDFKDIDKIDHIKGKVAKKIGITPDKLLEGERNYSPSKDKQIQFGFSNNPLILGFVKIIVEFAIIYCPEFTKSSYSKRFIELLLNNKIDDELKWMINFNAELSSIVYKLFVSRFYNDLQNSHIVFITVFQGIGLIGIVKIFEIIHIIILAPDVNKIQKSYLFFGNDYVKKMKFAKYLRNFSNSSIIIEGKYTETYFSQNNIENENGIPSIFNEKGEEICKNIFQIPSMILSDIIEGNYFDSLKCIYNHPGLFFKDKSDNKLIPIKEISFNGIIDSFPC